MEGIKITSTDFYKSRAMFVCCHRWGQADV